MTSISVPDLFYGGARDTEVTPDTVDIAWNDPVILAAAGETPGLVQDLLRRNKQPVPTTWAIYQWVSRRAIPNAWRPRIIYALLREQRIAVARLFRIGSPRRRRPDSAVSDSGHHG